MDLARQKKDENANVMSRDDARQEAESVLQEMNIECERKPPRLDKGKFPPFL